VTVELERSKDRLGRGPGSRAADKWTQLDSCSDRPRRNLRNRAPCRRPCFDTKSPDCSSLLISFLQLVFHILYLAARLWSLRVSLTGFAYWTSIRPPPEISSDKFLWTTLVSSNPPPNQHVGFSDRHVDDSPLIVVLSVANKRRFDARIRITLVGSGSVSPRGGPMGR
jgi:hypothetical protein